MTERKDIALNNLGASHIESGKYSDAIKVLSKALKRCRKVKVARTTYRRGHPTNSTPTSDKMYHLDTWMSHSGCNDGPSEKGCSTSMSPVPASLGCQTIRIPTAVLDYRSEAMVPVAMTFNLALAHHLLALQRNGHDVALRRAAELYKFVLDFHLKTDAPLSTCVRFVITSLNNLGHAYRTLEDKEMSDFFFEKVISIQNRCDGFQIVKERPGNLNTLCHGVNSSVVVAASQ